MGSEESLLGICLFGVTMAVTITAETSWKGKDLFALLQYHCSSLKEVGTGTQNRAGI